MNTKEKGWIKHYLHIRNQYALQKEFERLSAIDTATYNPEKFLYQLLQPTGIMYGHPTRLPLEIKPMLRALRIDSLSETDKTSIVLLESFLHSALTSPRYSNIEEAIDLADATLEAALLIGRFYKAVYKGMDISYQHWFFQQERRGMQLSEFVLSNKASDRNSVSKFWPNFFNSSLSFLDLLYFSKWIDAEKTEPEAIRIADEHEEMRFLIFQVIVSAALANDIIEPEERQLFESYIQAVYFSEDTSARCQKYLERPIAVEQLDFSAVSSQILRKYIFELATLIIYSDKMVTKEEKYFLDRLRKKLGLGKHEMEASMVAVESFIASYWQQMEFLQNKENLNMLEEQVLIKLIDALNQHQQTLSEHIQRDQQVSRLLQKAQREKLTNEEKNVVQKSLTNIIQGLPSAILHSVPKTFFTYPLLMQMIPEGVVNTELYMEAGSRKS